MPWAQGHMLFWEWIVRLSEMTPASDDRHQSVMFHSYFKSLNEQNSWRKFHQVLFGSGNGIFYALSERLGTPNWQFDVGSPIYTSASVHRGGQGCLGVLGSEMRSRKQGIEIWGSQEATPCSRAHQSSTVPHSGFVYFGSENGKMYALNELTGALIWTYDAFSPIRSPKVLRSISDLIFKHGFCRDLLTWPWYDSSLSSPSPRHLPWMQGKCILAPKPVSCMPSPIWPARRAGNFNPEHPSTLLWCGIWAKTSEQLNRYWTVSGTVKQGTKDDKSTDRNKLETLPV